MSISRPRPIGRRPCFSWNRWYCARAPTMLLTTPAKAFDAAKLEDFKTTNVCKYCDLTDAQLSSRDMRGADFQNTNLSGSVLKNANLSEKAMEKRTLSANFEGANLLSYIFEFAQNREMIRNALRILNDNFQEFLTQLNSEESEQTKEAKKKYNAPRTGKMKKRWSVKYKKSIDCSHPKGFSQKQFCKRKRKGGAYKSSK